MQRDYHSVLTIHGLPSMTPKKIKSIVRWLHNTATMLEKESKDPKIFSRCFRARYMK